MQPSVVRHCEQQLVGASAESACMANANVMPPSTVLSRCSMNGAHADACGNMGGGGGDGYEKTYSPPSPPALMVTAPPSLR